MAVQNLNIIAQQQQIMNNSFIATTLYQINETQNMETDQAPTPATSPHHESMEIDEFTNNSMIDTKNEKMNIDIQEVDEDLEIADATDSSTDNTTSEDEEMNTDDEDIQMSDDENCCPSEFGADSDDEMNDSDPVWDNNNTSTFDENHHTTLQKEEGDIQLLSRLEALPIPIQERIMSFLSPTDYKAPKTMREKVEENGFTRMLTDNNLLAAELDREHPPFCPCSESDIDVVEEIGGIFSNTTLCTRRRKRAENPLLACNCNKSYQPIRHDHRPLAPQLLRVNKRLCNHLTETYFGQGRFAVKIDFFARDEEERNEMTGNGDIMGLEYGSIHGIRKNKKKKQPSTAVSAVLHWNQVKILPNMESYPFSFVCVKTLDLHINFTTSQFHYIQQFAEELQKLAQIFAPQRAPKKLQKLCLKLHFGIEAYAKFKGNVGDHLEPRNLPRMVRNLIRPFYVFSGSKNGDHTSEEMVDTIWRKTVEVNIDAGMFDGLGDTEDFLANQPAYIGAQLNAQQVNAVPPPPPAQFSIWPAGTLITQMAGTAMLGTVQAPQQQ
ncbi:uncharacterized protein PAC_11152 [Phialocephala subalpina]|uniref:Uncharacterized protein n=1 Tax=Phialocephala subalpina TaxID=576137 RepID=A0A1L7X8C0_9HELO|nr:uncharacterized protein PAC_11152 [Phialocephala subalpina]